MQAGPVVAVRLPTPAASSTSSVRFGFCSYASRAGADYAVALFEGARNYFAFREGGVFCIVFVSTPLGLVGRFERSERIVGTV